MMGIKVVTTDEMRRMEQLAYDQGASEALFMENAGKAIAELVDEYATEQGCEKAATLVVGKGNNGGDAFAAGIYLLQKGYEVLAYQPFLWEECSPLCQQQWEQFLREGGEISSEVHFLNSGVILDGLVGTGFKGKAENILAEAIEAINDSHLPVIAIDIPSGLNGTTGEVETLAVHADVTIALGFPKIGFYIASGWDHVGTVVIADFGLDQKWVNQARPVCYLIDESAVVQHLPPIQRNRHKYTAGYVLGVAGSFTMSGAASLSSLAALRAGAGIVRLFYRESVQGLPPEVMSEPLNKLERVFEEAKRATSIFIGPGLGRSKEVAKLLKSLLQRLALPAVLDADALYLLSEKPRFPLPEKSILTPHHQEMVRLLHGIPLQEELDLYQHTQRYAEEKRVTIVLKGAPTWIFHPGYPPLLVPRGDPGMATAGSGDVLTGIIAALLAQGVRPYPAAVLGVYLHALAGEAAAFERTSYSLIASDIIHHLSDAFDFLTHSGE